jgi:uncharacterized protein (TIGR04255 family)
VSFPESDRIDFRQNPLVEVICQLRFPTILTIASELPAAFQEQVREAYPVYERDPTSLSVPAPIANLISEFSMGGAELVVHRFISDDGNTTIALSKDFIAVSQLDYTDWQRFRAEVDRAKRALEAIYHPAFYSRIGLRYRDEIDRGKLGLGEQSWAELLIPPILGLLGAEEQIVRGVRAVRSEAVVQLERPPESFVKIMHGLVDEVGSVYSFDADMFTTERKETELVFDTLDDFNRQAGDLWRWAIADPLRAALGSRDD